MTDPIAVSITASMIAAKIECASYLADDHPTVQLLARFESETRKDERERCAKVADGADVDRDAAFIIAAAIRNLGEG